ncbi:hypothetical protein LINGRAHAP2_LOCUS8033 [Linum grandiflorum]
MMLRSLTVVILYLVVVIK